MSDADQSGSRSRVSWAARAGVEFLIIVVGVLVALWMEGWREGRVEARMERIYLERMLVDLRRGNDGLRIDGLDHLRAAERNMRIVSPFLRYGDPVPEDTLTFLGALYGASRSLLLSQAERYPSTAFDEMEATGGFSLIRDRDLRSAILAHYTQVEESSPQFDLQPRGYRDMIRGLIPADLQKTIRDECLALEPGSRCDYDVGRLDVPGLLRRLQGNLEASAALEFSLQQTVISIPFVEALIADGEALIDLIETELGR